jgi:hypothetical protein
VCLRQLKSVVQLYNTQYYTHICVHTYISIKCAQGRWKIPVIGIICQDIFTICLKDSKGVHDYFSSTVLIFEGIWSIDGYNIFGLLNWLNSKQPYLYTNLEQIKLQSTGGEVLCERKCYTRKKTILHFLQHWRMARNRHTVKKPLNQSR